MNRQWRAGAPNAASTTVFLARHGQTDWNVTGRYHGRADVQLNAEGHRQTQALAPIAAQLALDSIWTSPLSRARATADAIAEAGGLHPRIDERLTEVDVGSWVGLDVSQVCLTDPGYATARRQGADRRFSATGEKPGECAARMAEVLTELSVVHAGGRVMAVSHGFAIVMGVGRLLGLDVPQSHRLAGLLNCAWGELTTDGERWRLEAWNTCHDQIPGQRTGEIITV